MGKDVMLIIDRIKSDLSLRNEYISRRESAKSLGNNGLQNKYSRLVANIQNRVRHNLKEIAKIGVGNTITIIYTHQNTKYKEVFTNITSEEVKQLLYLKSELLGVEKPIILEIEDIPTSIQEVGL